MGRVVLVLFIKDQRIFLDHVPLNVKWLFVVQAQLLLRKDNVKNVALKSMFHKTEDNVKKEKDAAIINIEIYRVTVKAVNNFKK